MRTLVILSILAAWSSAAHAEDTADLVFVNGKVYTLDERRPWVEALAIKGEWILAAGTWITVGQRFYRVMVLP